MFMHSTYQYQKCYCRACKHTHTHTHTYCGLVVFHHRLPPDQVDKDTVPKRMEELAPGYRHTSLVS